MTKHICPPDHRHGWNQTCYVHHACRCDECRTSSTAACRRTRRGLPDPRIDPYAVDMTLAGQEVYLTASQRAEAVRELWRLRWSDGAIAERLRMTDRTVGRVRHRLSLPAWQMHELKRTKQLERKSA